VRKECIYQYKKQMHEQVPDHWCTFIIYYNQ